MNRKNQLILLLVQSLALLTRATLDKEFLPLNAMDQSSQRLLSTEVVSQLSQIDILLDFIPAINAQKPSSSQATQSKYYVYQNGTTNLAFDPSQISRTCQPQPKYTVYGQNPLTTNTTQKKVFQDFIVFLPKDKQISSFNMKLTALAVNSPLNAQVSPATIQVESNKEHSFDVSYDCLTLLNQGHTYFDTVRIMLQHGEQTINFEYLVVCDQAQLRNLDLNFLMLFAIAVIVIVVAIKSPPLLIFKEMTSEEQEQTDLKLSQAVCFFVMASTMLLVLYLFLDQIKTVFTLLILVSCIGCTSIIVEDFLLQMLKPGEESFLKKEIKFPYFGNCNIASLIGVAVGLTLSITWYITHNWLLNNILALLLSLTFLKTLRLTTLVPGMVLLGLLFFYDIFWVFLSPYFTSGGQSVMVAVATGLDIPIKIVMPHLTNAYPTTSCSLLGLGDILIPGIFITFMARFGFEVVNSKSYFYAAIIGYSLALLACGASLFIFKAAQPALLYIVPALYIAVISLGCYRGEWQMLKTGIPKQSEYRNQALHEEDPFRSTARELDKKKGTGGTFELMKLETRSGGV